MINLDSNDYVINKKDQKLLKQFEKQVLNSQILYPFHPIRHINFIRLDISTANFSTLLKAQEKTYYLIL